MSEKQTAFDRVHFNEYGDYLDKPYVVRALKSFDVNRVDGDGFLIENEFFTVEEGSVWEIDGPSFENDVHLVEVVGKPCAVHGFRGNVYGTLNLNWDDLKLFELLEEGGYYDDDAHAERLRWEGECE